MKQQIFAFHSDEGHGWLKVPMVLLIELGIAGQVSSYSYEYSDHVYLEEDCDMGLFVEAWRKAGFELQYKTRTSVRSRVRTYPCYYPKAV